MDAVDFTVSHAVDAWLSDLEGRSSPRTMKTVRCMSGFWRRALGALKLRSVTVDDLRRYLAARRGGARPIKASTGNADIVYLRWFWRWALDEGLATESPAKRLQKTKVRRAQPTCWTVAEHGRLLLAAGDLRPLVEVASETGIRFRALLGLEWSHVDLAEGRVRIPASLMKSGCDFEAPLSRRAVEVLSGVERSGLRVFRFSASGVRRRFQRALDAAGVRGTFHTTRKYFLTSCRRRGVPLEVAMRLADHRDLRTLVEIYRAIDQADLLRAVGREERDDAGDGQFGAAGPRASVLG